MEAVATQFTLDLEFVSACLGHALVIFFLVIFLARADAVWRWIGLPVQKQKQRKQKIK